MIAIQIILTINKALTKINEILIMKMMR